MDFPNDLNNWFLQNGWIYYLTMAIGITLPIVYTFFANRGKIRVRIKSIAGMPEKSLFVKPMEKLGKAVLPIIKEGKKKLGWTPEITGGSIYPSKFYWRDVNTVDIIEGMSKTIKYDYTTKSIEAPELTQQEVSHYAKAAIWEPHFQRGPKEVMHGIFWIMVGGIILVAALQIYFQFVQLNNLQQQIDTLSKTLTQLGQVTVP